MRILGLLVGTLVLLTCAGTAFGQGCVCSSFSKSVTIVISEGAGGAAKVDQDRVCLASGGDVTFQSDEGDYEVNFNKGDGTPFTAGVLRGKRAERKSNKLTRPHKVSCGRLYRYTVVLKKDGKTLTLDPEIIVEPSGDGN